VFEGMRDILLRDVMSWHHLAAAIVLNMVWIGAASLLFAWQFREARVRGALLSIGE
jgi:ABC-2 type transport system permease protein